MNEVKLSDSKEMEEEAFQPFIKRTTEIILHSIQLYEKRSRCAGNRAGSVLQSLDEAQKLKDEQAFALADPDHDQLAWTSSGAKRIFPVEALREEARRKCKAMIGSILSRQWIG